MEFQLKSLSKQCGSCVLKASVDQVSTDTISQHVDRVSVDISADTWSPCQPTLDRHVHRHQLPLHGHACQMILGQQATDTLLTRGLYFTDTWLIIN